MAYRNVWHHTRHAARSRVRWGVALALCGYEAADVPLLLADGYCVGQIVLVDRDSACLASASAKYPGITVFHGEIEDAVIEYGGLCDLLVLDVCGPLSGGARTALEHWSKHPPLFADGLVATHCAIVTVLRGREHFSAIEEQGRRSQALFGNKLFGPRGKAREEAICGPVRRLFDIASAIQSKAVVTGWYEYFSSSPMGVAVVSFPPSREWMDSAKEKHPGCFQWLKVEGTARDAARWLLADGYTSTTVAEFLNLPVSSVRAWKAHSTRGTYVGDLHLGTCFDTRDMIKRIKQRQSWLKKKDAKL